MIFKCWGSLGKFFVLSALEGTEIWPDLFNHISRPNICFMAHALIMQIAPSWQGCRLPISFLITYRICVICLADRRIHLLVMLSEYANYDIDLILDRQVTLKSTCFWQTRQNGGYWRTSIVKRWLWIYFQEHDHIFLFSLCLHHEMLAQHCTNVIQTFCVFWATQ